MSGYVFSETDSGIVRADLGADGAAVDRALKQHDPALRLIPQPGYHDGEPVTVWKVYRRCSSDHAEFLIAWQTDRGEPKPLSMALVDEVQRHDRNTQGAIVEAEVANAQLRAARDKEFQDAKETIVEETAAREEKGRIHVFPRSRAFAFARRRGRRKGTTYDSEHLKQWSR